MFAVLCSTTKSLHRLRNILREHLSLRSMLLVTLPCQQVTATMQLFRNAKNPVMAVTCIEHICHTLHFYKHCSAHLILALVCVLPLNF